MSGLFRLLLITIVFWTSSTSAETMLRIKFQKGETQKLKMTMAQSIKMQIPGQPTSNIDISQTMDTEVRCDDVTSDGVASVRQRITRVRSTTKLPPPLNQNVEYDSDQKVPPSDRFAMQMENTMRPMIGVDWSMKLSPLGRLTEFKMPQDALKGIQGTQLAAMGGDMFSEEGLKRMSEQASIQFEEKALQPGETWTTPIEIKSLIGIMKLSRHQTYVGPDSESGTEKIDVKVTIELEPSNDPKLAGAKISLKSGSGSGVILFDNQRGRVRESRIKTEIEMEIAAGPQTIQQTIEGDVSIEDVTGTSVESP